MSRLTLTTKDQAQETIEILYKDLERRIEASQPGLCPVDLAEAFVHMCHAQSCGKCTPCRIGLGQLGTLINDVLDGKATMETLDTIEHTAESIFYTADCAIGSVSEDSEMSMNHISMRASVAVHTTELFHVFQCVLHTLTFLDISLLSMKADMKMLLTL